MVLPLAGDRVGILGYLTSANRAMLRPPLLKIRDAIPALIVPLPSLPILFQSKWDLA